MFKKYATGSLRQKLLVPTMLLLSLSIIGLSLILAGVQQKQLTTLRESVLSLIETGNRETKNSLSGLSANVNESLNSMANTASETLASSTREALENEKRSMGAELETMLKESGQSLADLLARVAPAAILSNNFTDLLAYAKSATQNPDVVYAIYVKDDGKPLTRYLNQEDPIIQGYLKTGEGKKKFEKVLNASFKDDGVFIIERPVELDGRNLGKLFLCVNRSSARKKTEEMSGRFSALITANTVRINAVFEQESKNVSTDMERMLASVRSRNTESAEAIAGSMQAACNAVTSKTRQIIAVLGFSSVVIVCIVLFLVLTRLSKKVGLVVDNLAQSAETVNASSSQISAASQSLAEGASSQAASIEETSSSLEEMSARTRQNADHSTQADKLMKDAIRIVAKANASMNELTSSMSEISKASEETQKIVKTIDEIAFQTNLLALNAAVEAARAGEAGAGFAVVADEVRNLAMRAASAAQNTAQLIKDTAKKIDDGSKLVTFTDKEFNEVATVADKVAGLVSEIAVASDEQARGLEQVNTAVGEIDRVIQQNAANAEESAAASEAMSSQADQMKAWVGELAAIVYGAARKIEIEREPEVSPGEDEAPEKTQRGSGFPGRHDQWAHVEDHQAGGR